MNALGPGSCGTLNSRTMMVMMTATPPSENDSKREAASCSSPRSVGWVFGSIAPSPQLRDSNGLEPLTARRFFKHGLNPIVAEWRIIRIAGDKFFFRVLYVFAGVSLGSANIGSRRFGDQKFAFAKFFHALFQILLLLAGDRLVVILCVGGRFFALTLFSRHCSVPLQSLISRS